MRPRHGANREARAPGRNLLARPSVVLAATTLALLLPLVGCSSDSGGGGEDRRLVVDNFNQHRLPGVLMNSPLVFTFSTAVDPATVNDSTIQIWTTVGGKRADAPGSFEVNGAVVTWFPQATSKVYPLQTTNNTDPIMPNDAGLNTAATGFFTYQVLVPSSPDPNTVRSLTGKPVESPFTSSFETIQGPQVLTPGNSSPLTGIFDARVPYFRDTIRIADVLAYGGTLTPPTGYLGWLNNPASSLEENPLFVAPGFYPYALDVWTGRDRTGEEVDQLFHIALVPRMTANDMVGNVFPPNAPANDERFVSNTQGTLQGRTRLVSGINVFFTQPLAADSFLSGTNNPLPYTESPIEVRVLPTAGTNPTGVTQEPYTLTFLNNTDLHVALVDITLNRAITQGWIHISVATLSKVKGMPGGALQANLPGEFVFIWPAKINAP